MPDTGCFSKVEAREEAAGFTGNRSWLVKVLALAVCLALFLSPAVLAQTEVSGNITTDTVWTADKSPYLLTGSVTVQGTDGSDGVTTLTIEPGVEVRFARYAQLQVGNYSGDPGALKAEGTAQNPIVFTSAQSSPAPGDWHGLWFYNTADDEQCVLRHCIVEYAAPNYGAVWLNNASPEIFNTTIRFCKNYGIYACGAGCSQARIECCTFRNNTNGIDLSGGAAPRLISHNNFMENSQYAIYYSGSSVLVAENNWWNDPAGPGKAGDRIYGNIDADPWSATQNSCDAGIGNRPPLNPDNPSPADKTAGLPTTSLAMTWSCSDPDQDTLSYDLYMGLSADNLQLVAQDLTMAGYTKSDLPAGKVYYWKVVAKDGKGYRTPGPVWLFATKGDPPDLVIGNIATVPGGGMRPGNRIQVKCIVKNKGTGPATNDFKTELKIDGSPVQEAWFESFIGPGTSAPIVFNWTYNGRDPVITITADSENQVAETHETNNQGQAQFSVIADITPPEVTSQFPAGGARLTQIQQVIIALHDSQSDVDDRAVKTYLSLYDPSQRQVRGTVSEKDDVFTFTPSNLPLADGQYQVRFRATDTFGNWQNHSFDFFIDTQPPSKPVVTGGTVTSGTIEPRPASNSSDRAAVTLEGTCEPGAFVWANGQCQGRFESGNWAFRWLLSPGDNSIELYCRDEAGNRGQSEWVDIRLQGQGGIMYEYDAAGRLRKVRHSP